MVETESNEVAGKEVVYTPLEWDPSTPIFSDFNTHPNDGSAQSYSIFVLELCTRLVHLQVEVAWWSGLVQKNQR